MLLHWQHCNWFSGTIPFREVPDKEKSDLNIQQFEFQFNYKHLRQLMLVSWKRRVWPKSCQCISLRKHVFSWCAQFIMRERDFKGLPWKMPYWWYSSTEVHLLSLWSVVAEFSHVFQLTTNQGPLHGQIFVELSLDWNILVESQMSVLQWINLCTQHIG